MRALSVIVALFLTGAAQASSARENLSAADTAGVKRICSSLLGTQYMSASWRRLTPYLRDKHAMDSPIVCSASCSGSIALRGGLWFDFVFVNPQKMGKPWGSGDGLVYSITLGSRKDTILHRETVPKT